MLSSPDRTKRSRHAPWFRIAVSSAVFAFTVFGAYAAGASTIIQPTGTPHLTANAPLTVVASGFQAGQQVFVEQCDGKAPTAPQWSPTLDCDLGGSPPAALASANGQASFPGTDANRAFRPFQGESPQSLFNCMAAGHQPPANGLPSFTNCQVRVSSNNAAATADQVFFPIVLTGASVPLPSVPSPTTTTTPAGGAKGAKPGAKPGAAAAAAAAGKTTTTVGAGKKKSAAGATEGTTKSTVAKVDAAPAVATLHSNGSPSHGGAGLFGFSNGGVGVGYLVVLVGLAIALGPVLIRRRRVAALQSLSERPGNTP